MRICICIQACKNDFFLKEAKILTTSYKRTAAYLNLPVKCWYYTGSGNRASYFGDDEILLAGSDSDTSEKTRSLLGTLLYTDFTDFDVLVRTNTCTVVNIEKLYAFIHNKYDKGVAYCGGFVHRWQTGAPELTYPNGNFYILSRQICSVLYSKWQMSEKSVKKLFKIDGDTGINGTMWTGVAEDLLTGFILRENGIQIKRIGAFLNFRRTISENLDMLGPDIYDYIGVYAKTHPTDLNARTAIEPEIIEFLSLMFERHACAEMPADTV